MGVVPVRRPQDTPRRGCWKCGGPTAGPRLHLYHQRVCQGCFEEYASGLDRQSGVLLPEDERAQTRSCNYCGRVVDAKEGCPGCGAPAETENAP